MKKMILRGLAALMLFVAAAGTANAQDMQQLPPIPVDSAVIKGKLDNGKIGRAHV